jgi:hypothetical protein
MLINKVLDVDLTIPTSVKEKFFKKKWEGNEKEKGIDLIDDLC